MTYPGHARTLARMPDRRPARHELLAVAETSSGRNYKWAGPRPSCWRHPASLALTREQRLKT
jgi:hypothetical protein